MKLNPKATQTRNNYSESDLMSETEKINSQPYPTLLAIRVEYRCYRVTVRIAELSLPPLAGAHVLKDNISMQ